MKQNKEKPYCGGTWTESKYKSFIKSGLRTMSVRWPPRYQALADAFDHQGINPSTGRLAKLYRCKSCNNLFPASGMEVNHKDPVIPIDGFKSWDDVIQRLFCEKEGLEALCRDCHKKVTKEENAERKRIRNSS